MLLFKELEFVFWLQSVGLVYNPGISFFVRTITTLTAGTVFLMWVGEQISVKGIGNGVSLIIFLNVISRAPSSVIQTVQKMQGDKFLIPLFVLVAFLATVTIAGIVLFQLGQRKIPIHYVGKGFSSKSGIGEKSFIPLRLNTAGVMPVIFASVFMLIPGVIVNALPSDLQLKNNFIYNIWAKSPSIYDIVCFSNNVLLIFLHSFSF